MKFTSTSVFGAASVAVGILAIYFNNKQNNGTTIIPPLSAANNVASSTTPTSSGTTPYQALPNQNQVSTGPAQNVPYLVSNFGARHNAHKAVQAAAESQATQQAAQQKGNCCCESSCGGSKHGKNTKGGSGGSGNCQYTPSWGTNLPDDYYTKAVQNINTVGLIPSGPSIQASPALYSSIQQYNNQVAGDAWVNETTNQGSQSINNVPGSDYGVWAQ